MGGGQADGGGKRAEREGDSPFMSVSGWMCMTCVRVPEARQPTTAIGKKNRNMLTPAGATESPNLSYQWLYMRLELTNVFSCPPMASH